MKKNETLEIEAKLGMFEIYQDKQAFFSTPSPIILPELRGAYRFNNGVTEEQFMTLKSLLFVESEKREIERKKNDTLYPIERAPVKETIDRRTTDGWRCSFLKDAEIPFEILKKTNKKHFNYKRNTPGEYDLRISVNIEEKYPDVENFDFSKIKAGGARHKKRWSYKFRFLTFDFTQTQNETTAGDLELPTYEIELEISDPDMVKNCHHERQRDYLQRFYANIESLLKGASPFGQEALFYEMTKLRQDEAFALEFESKERPLIGDYLAEKSLEDRPGI